MTIYGVVSTLSAKYLELEEKSNLGEYLQGFDHALRMVVELAKKEQREDEKANPKAEQHTP